jgi:hypothetical protein
LTFIKKLRGRERSLLFILHTCHAVYPCSAAVGLGKAASILDSFSFVFFLHSKCKAMHPLAITLTALSFSFIIPLLLLVVVTTAVVVMVVAAPRVEH